MFRLCLNSWTIFETLLSIIRSVVIPNRSYAPPYSGNGLDGAPTGNIQAESQTYCESLKRSLEGISDGSTGRR